MRKRLLLLSLILLLALVGCSGAGTGGTAETDTGEATTDEEHAEGDHEHGTLKVASKGFTEAYILGEMYALLLENHGYTVERKLGLGTETVVHEGMLAGDVDLYPEYTSTGLLAILQGEPMAGDPATMAQAIYDKVKADYESQFQITWLDAAPFNNTQALAVTRETSEKLGLTKVSQLVELAPDLRIGGAPEFYERGDGLPGLEETYGPMEFAEEVQVDSGLRYQALMDGQFEVVVAYGTDGQIGGFDLIVLEDDMGLWPPYQVAPVIRQSVLEQYPDIADTLNALAPLLTDEVMANLNWMVDGPDKMEYEDVARTFLIENQLLPPE